MATGEPQLEESKTITDTNEERVYGWNFHRWPFGIAVAVTLVLYGLIWLFVDPTPPHIDPSELPPPPGSF